MSLTEIQRPENKQQLFGRCNFSADRFDQEMRSVANFAEALNFIDESDMDALNIDAGEARTNLVNYRIALNEMVAFYYGMATTQTNIPADVIDKIRTLK